MPLILRRNISAVGGLAIFIMLTLCIFAFTAGANNGPFSIRINIGGSGWTDHDGNEWLGDHIYRASSGYGYLGLSSVFEKDIAITGTTIPTIYKTERYKLFGYRIDVPNGHYLVKLHFAEIYYKQEGKRLFDIKLEDRLVKERLDIFKEVGENKALVLQLDTESLATPVTDNRIDIEFISIKDDTKLSGIEVVQKASQPALFQMTPDRLDFSRDLNSIMLALKNIGVRNSNWTISKEDPSNRWITLPTVTTGTINASEERQLEVRIDRNALRNGVNEASLIISGGNFSKKIPVSAVRAGSAELTAESLQLDFGSNALSMPFVLTNSGGSPLEFTIVPASIPNWVKRIYPSSGTIAVGNKAYLNLVIDRSQLPTGTHRKSIEIRSSSNSIMPVLSVDIPTQANKHIYVNVNNTGKEDGRTWETGYRSISDLLSRLKRIPFNDIIEIWVAQGTYYEHDMIVPSNVHLYGGFRGAEACLEERAQPHLYASIIDAQRRGRCFEIGNQVVIDGFVLQNGRDWGTGEGKGAAVLAYDAHVRISNNIVRNNVDSWAGAVFIEGFEESKKVPGATPIIEYNVFTDNFSNYCAAAIEIRGSKAIVRHNTIVRNQGYGLEIQDLLGPFQEIVYGDFYHNIIVNNVRQEENNVWAEARKSTNYSFVGNTWSTLVGKFPPYGHGVGNIFGDESGQVPRFIDERRDNFRLLENSPCIDAGDPEKTKDSDGSRADLGAFPYDRHRTTLEISDHRVDFGSESLKRYVTLSAYGGKGAAWNALIADDCSDHIKIEPSAGYLKNGEQARLELTLSRNTLTDGIYRSYCAVVTPEQSCEFQLSFIINNSKPELEVDPTSIQVVATLNGTSPQTRRIQVANTMVGGLPWRAISQEDGNWLRLLNNSGQENEFLILEFNTSHLDLGEYQQDILIEAPTAINRNIVVPVTLNVQTEQFSTEIQAESAASIPKVGWKISTNHGESCLQALRDDLKQPDDLTRIDYPFEVPEGVDYVHVFAEVDVNQSRTSDSFWMTVNGFDPCEWDYIDSRSDGWLRSWVYDIDRDKQHTFIVRPGVNTLNIYSREKGGFINWFVVTNDPDIDIKSYRIGK